MPDLSVRALWALDPEYGHAPYASPDRVELHVHLGTPEEPQTAL